MQTGNTAQDIGQREFALDPNKSFIVQAPAGSGKTELLIQRYLALLAQVEKPESIVSITFTRKAAGEMRWRVLKALEAAAGPKPEKPYAVLTWKLAQEVRKRDSNGGWDLSSNAHRLNIRTMDSLCASITHQMPWVSRLGGPSEIVEDPGELYREAARQTIALVENKDWSDMIARLLFHLDNDVQALEGLIGGMLARRDQWLRHIGVDGDRAEQRAALESALRNVLLEALQRVRELIPDTFARDVVELASFAGKNLQDQGGNSNLCACAGMQALPGTDVNGLDLWLGISELLLTAKDGWRKSVTVKNGFPPKEKAWKERMTTLLAALEHREDFRESLSELRILPPTVFDQSQWEVVEALLTVLPVAVAQLTVIFSQNGAVDYSEVALGALRALGEPENPTDLALSLDYRIEHLLIDELQDTSLSQFSLLEKLTTGWQPGDGRTLFAVGDPMQSIYRFREAEVGLFLKAWRQGIGSIKLDPLRLVVNFRSEEGIVDWVNDSFSQLFPESEDIATGAIRFSKSVAINPPGTSQAIHMHTFLGRNDNAEAQRVVEVVTEALSRDRKAKIAILVRARTHLPSILTKLRIAGVKYRAVEIDALGELSIIQDLMALTRALLHAGDRSSWLAILRAPWCGLTLADLHALVADAPSTAVWDLISDAACSSKLSQDGQFRLDRMRGVLGKALTSRKETLRSWVEGTWLFLGGPACAVNQAELESCSTFFDLLETLDEGRDIDLDSFEDHVGSLFASPDPESSDTLQVMSIHKAKGLEFDIVIVPGLGRKPRIDDPKLLLWLERPSRASRSELLLAPIKETGAEENNLYGYLKHVDQQKADYEAARLLYVASTRAKKELHLLGHTKCKFEDGECKLSAPESASLLRRLWPVVEREFQKHADEAVTGLNPEVTEQTITEAPAISIRRLRNDWVLPNPPPSVNLPHNPAEMASADTGRTPSFLWVGETLRHVGTVVHRMLQQIATEDTSGGGESQFIRNHPAIETALRSLGVSPPEIKGATQQVERAIAQTMEDPRGAWILGRSHLEAQCELPLTGEIDGNIVSALIDRTFVDEHGVRWIIDYKTSTHGGGDPDAFLDNEQERYRAQLELYRRLFSKLEDRPIRLGLYFPLLQGWREYF